MSERNDQCEHEEFHGDAAIVKRESARRTRRSFVVGGAAAAAGYGLLHWVNNGGPVIGRQQEALRRTFQADAAIARAVFDERGLAPTYPLSHAKPLRLNGSVGIDQELVLSSWRLQVAGAANAAQHPRFAKDITAWQYEYAGDVPDSGQSNDVKSAPGNGDKSKTGDDTKSDNKSSGPDAQKPAGDGKSSPDQSAKTAQEPGSGAGSGQALKSVKPNTLNPSGASDSAAGAALADRIAKMVAASQPVSKKRNVGDEEAGPSASSLDIGTPGLLLTMDDLLKLPKVELITEFKCIEGWSNVTQWAGVRLRDVIEAYPPEKVNGREPRFVYMETPDGNYYGGYDMSAARHPQSLLVMEMGGEPLTQQHGAPLRLHMPIKYGYKQLKRVGLIAYTDIKPDDYWTKLGYDWYAGL